MQFLIDAKEGKKELKVPVYSHLTYDIVPDKFTIVDRPNVIIIEGVNVLQDGTEYPEFRKKPSFQTTLIIQSMLMQVRRIL